MRLIHRIRQRLADWRRERRIRDLGACCQFELAAGRTALGLEAWNAMIAEINARSPEQVARMERAKELARP